jgi:hypothetical protein
MIWSISLNSQTKINSYLASKELGGEATNMVSTSVGWTASFLIESGQEPEELGMSEEYANGILRTAAHIVAYAREDDLGNSWRVRTAIQESIDSAEDSELVARAVCFAVDVQFATMAQQMSNFSEKEKITLKSLFRVWKALDGELEH